MTASLMRRDPPRASRTGPQGATTPLDFEILAALERAEELQLREIKAMTVTAMRDPLISTHQVHARLATLAGRGLVERVPRPGGPRRGPGASTYRVVRDG